ncbi:hypothetical protein BC830DRAFT_827006 [Chytriomyces sp. MP71]|nr:hypothetical protein BC830DRAFT_827006 [Chytriomyces sp. MP71]
MPREPSKPSEASLPSFLNKTCVERDTMKQVAILIKHMKNIPSAQIVKECYGLNNRLKPDACDRWHLLGSVKLRICKSRCVATFFQSAPPFFPPLFLLSLHSTSKCAFKCFTHGSHAADAKRDTFSAATIVFATNCVSLSRAARDSVWGKEGA